MEPGVDAGVRPVVCALSVSDILRDARVCRQCDACHDAGWQVFAAGLGTAPAKQRRWTLLAAPAAASTGPDAPTRSGRLVRRSRTALSLLRARMQPSHALRFFWDTWPEPRIVYQAARRVRADLWIANDWTALPIAARLAAERGGRYAYDSHELAVDENEQRRAWRMWNRPVVRAIERRLIGGAAFVATVSPGIAEELRRRYRLERSPLVVRNTPSYGSVPFRPAGDRIRVLFHGIVVPGRGLEECIDSVALWRPEFDLSIRGPGAPSYIDSLRRRIVERGVAERVTLLPPVAAGALVAEAAAFDIGMHPLPGHSRHNRLSLSNKLFDYIMAGLALCVSNLPEMARLLRDYRLGVTIGAVEPGAIAQAINGLDRPRLDAFKRNALLAARELCWENESRALVAACAAAVGEQASRIRS